MNKKFIILFVVLIAGIAVLATNTYFQKDNLNKNGIVSKAIIEQINSNKYENEIGTPVDNIHVEYKYIVDGKEIRKTQEILRHEHDLYFETNKIIGDSVTIIYDSKQPTNSRIEKIVQL